MAQVRYAVFRKANGKVAKTVEYDAHCLKSMNDLRRSLNRWKNGFTVNIREEDLPEALALTA